MTPHDLLEKHFGFREFLEGQERIVESILAGDDALVIMPTGGGKSLCFQAPAVVRFDVDVGVVSTLREWIEAVVTVLDGEGKLSPIRLILARWKERPVGWICHR